MAVYNKVVVTNEGIELLRDISLFSDRALNAGEAVTSASVMMDSEAATKVSDVVQSQAYSLYSRNANQFVLETQLTNVGITAAYALNTIGFYANDGRGADILLAVITAQTPDTIPPESAYPISINLRAVITLDKGGNVTVNASFAGYATMESLSDHVENNVVSDSGVHGIRYQGNKIQVNTGGDWIDSDGETTEQAKDMIVDAVSKEAQARQEQIDSLTIGLASRYIKPITGIPETDLSSEVQASLNKADTALQSVDFTNHAGNNTIHVTQTDKDNWNGKTSSTGSVTNVTSATASTITVTNGTTTPTITHVDSANIRHVTDTEKATWNEKQNALVSGTNVKTVNNESLLGSGNINIQSSGGTLTSVTAGTGITVTTSATSPTVSHTAHTGDVTGATALIIANNAVITAKILDANVTTAKIADLNVTAAKIAASAVTDAKLADNAVTTAKINASAVTDVKIAANAVITDKINNRAVTAAKLITSSTANRVLAVGGTANSDPAYQQVSTDMIADNAVIDAKIGNRTLADESASGTLVMTSAKNLTQWLQGIRNNLRSLFDHVAGASVHNATDAVAASRIILRDANGRANVNNPTENKHIATKEYVDGRVSFVDTYLNYYGWYASLASGVTGYNGGVFCYLIEPASPCGNNLCGPAILFIRIIVSFESANNRILATLGNNNKIQRFIQMNSHLQKIQPNTSVGGIAPGPLRIPCISSGTTLISFFIDASNRLCFDTRASSGPAFDNPNITGINDTIVLMSSM